MKKIFAVVAAVAVSSASLFAYNPPFGGEELFRLTNPEMLSGSSSSAAGGPAFNVIPASITYNPALPAGSEILTFDVSGTLFANLDKEDGDKSAGGAFEIAFDESKNILTIQRGGENHGSTQGENFQTEKRQETQRTLEARSSQCFQVPQVRRARTFSQSLQGLRHLQRPYGHGC